MHKPILTMILGQAGASMARFRDDERGSMTLIIIFTFLAMIIFGGIAVDVMRFELRRVALQQTIDRAALAASGLPDEEDTTKVVPPAVIANDWFAKAKLGDGIPMAQYSSPVVNAVSVPGKREVTISASVRSNNFFMGIFSPRDYLEGPASSTAAQGVANVEVMLVLDITGSMNGNIVAGKSKLTALKEAATAFVDIVEAQDTKHGVSIGVIPYAAQVNLPEELRDQFTEQYLSHWGGVASAGVPNQNCMELPTANYNQTPISRVTPIPMATIADTASDTDRTGVFQPASSAANGLRNQSQAGNEGAVACRTNAETTTTAWVDGTVNHVMLPTKDGEAVKTKVNRLTGYGTTNIAQGMRWASALMDETARPIYDNLIVNRATNPEPGMVGRPANNGSTDTRKIIVLMTDGEHVNTGHIVDAVKTGLSPIYRGEDGNYAIQFRNPASPATPIRPGSAQTPASRSCSGWALADYPTREYFVPHLKRASVQPRVGADPEGLGTGAAVNNACDPQAWKTSAAWPNSGAVIQLDWSQVWSDVRLSWVVQQLYVRSGTVGNTSFTTVRNRFRQNYLTSATEMDRLLQVNCAEARTAVAAGGAGFEIYGIMFDDAPSDQGIAAINGCASLPKSTYYYEPRTAEDLTAAFEDIAADIADLRLTQ